jgi:hypothetical protein
MSKQCKFKFRGNRKYIHSTDIYKFLKKQCLVINSLNFLIKSKSNKQLIFKYSNNSKLFAKKNVFCTGTLNDKKFFFLKTKKKIKKSYKFEENKFNKLFLIKKNTVYCEYKLNDEIIDLIICMINHLYKKKFPKKKYLLVSLIQKNKIDSSSQKKKIKITSTVNNYSPISLIKVYFNGKVYFEIVYFSEKRELV